MFDNRPPLLHICAAILFGLFFAACGFEPKPSGNIDDDAVNAPPVKVSPPLPREEKPRALAASFCTCQEEVFNKYGQKISELSKKFVGRMSDDETIDRFKEASAHNENMLQKLEACQSQIRKHGYFEYVTQDDALAESFANELEKCLKQLNVQYTPMLDKWAEYMEQLGGSQSEQLQRYKSLLEQMQK